MKKTKKIGLFFVVFFIIPLIIFCKNKYPKLIIKQDKFMKKKLNSEPDFNKKEPLEFNKKWIDATNSFEKVYESMWKDFNERGKKALPWCVYEAFNDLKKRGQIEIYLSIRELEFFPSGDVPIYGGSLGEYYNSRSEYAGIWIYGLWKDFYKDGGKKYCLKAVIFHEMLHYALDIADRWSSNSYFHIRNIKNPNGTDKNNFWNDEGIIEDCELKLFPCGEDSYKKNKESSWHNDKSRRYNTPEDDCVLCKLCKEK